MGMYICLASHWHRLKRAVTPIDGAGLFVALVISTRCCSAAGKPTVLDQARDPAVLHMSLSDPRSVCSRSNRLGPTVSGGDSVHQLSALCHRGNVRASLSNLRRWTRDAGRDISAANHFLSNARRG